MDNILLAATTVVAFVLATTQLIKTYTGAESKWLPLINLGLGIFYGIAWSWCFDSSNIIIYIWGGLIAGLSAGGFYDLGANLKMREDEE